MPAKQVGRLFMPCVPTGLEPDLHVPHVSPVSNQTHHSSNGILSSTAVLNYTSQCKQASALPAGGALVLACSFWPSKSGGSAEFARVLCKHRQRTGINLGDAFPSLCLPLSLCLHSNLAIVVTPDVSGIAARQSGTHFSTHRPITLQTKSHADSLCICTAL